MTTSDPHLFLRLLRNNQTRSYVCIHVDDTIVASRHEKELKDGLKETYNSNLK